MLLKLTEWIKFSSRIGEKKWLKISLKA